MNGPDLSTNVEHLLAAIRLCRAEAHYLPALILTYTGIDILASLENGSAKRSSFVDWVTRYFLPLSRLPCTAIELYAARCAVVHTLSPDSGLSRIGEARRILYAFGEEKSDQLQRSIEFLGDPQKDVAVHIDRMLDTFERSVRVFYEALRNDPGLSARVTKNARRFFSGVAPGDAYSILDISPS